VEGTTNFRDQRQFSEKPEADPQLPVAVPQIKKPYPPTGGTAESSHRPLCSGFPTLVLPRSGCEGRPIIRTLSRGAPLAIVGDHMLRCEMKSIGHWPYQIA